METLESIKGILDEPTDQICEKCGRPMVKKLGRFGFFIACTGFPECRNTKPVPLADCPKPDCDGKIVARRKHKTEEIIFLIFSIAAAYAFARHAAYWFGVVTDLYPVNPVTWLRPINKYMFGYTAILAGGIARSVWFDLGRPMIWRKRSESD